MFVLAVAANEFARDMISKWWIVHLVGTLFLMIKFISKLMGKLKLCMFATEQHVLDPHPQG